MALAQDLINEEKFMVSAGSFSSHESHIAIGWDEINHLSDMCKEKCEGKRKLFKFIYENIEYQACCAPIKVDSDLLPNIKVDVWLHYIQPTADLDKKSKKNIIAACENMKRKNSILFTSNTLSREKARKIFCRYIDELELAYKKNTGSFN